MSDSVLKYRKFESGDTTPIYGLIWRVFSEFEAPEYSEEGIQTFRAFIAPVSLANQIREGRLTVYCCSMEGVLVGVLAYRDFNHISLLFVDAKHHRKGIAKELLRISLKELVETGIAVEEITVNSSLYAVEIYKKMGFEPLDSMQTKNGIRFVPMKKMLQG